MGDLLRIGVKCCPLCGHGIYRLDGAKKAMVFKPFQGLSLAIQEFPRGLGGFKETTTFAGDICLDCKRDMNIKALIAFIHEKEAGR